MLLFPFYASAVLTSSLCGYLSHFMVEPWMTFVPGGKKINLTLPNSLSFWVVMVVNGNILNGENLKS